MPRDGSSIYHIPPGTHGDPDTTIVSTKYNIYVDDVAQDLNTPRPVIFGGTGATNADDALNTLGGEHSSQVVTNFDSQLWFPGSFYAASSASGSPVAGHAFVGWVISSDVPAVPPANQNLVVQARDQNDTTVPGRMYVREKKAGTWGPWKVDGRTIVGDAEGIGSDSADMFFGLKGASPASRFIVNSKGDVSGTNYVEVAKDGTVTLRGVALTVTQQTTFQGRTVLAADPLAGNNLDAATKQYVDARDAVVIASIPPPFPAGTLMLFVQNAAPPGWTKRTDYNDYALRLVNGNITAGGATGFSGIFGANTVGYHAITAAEMAYHVHAAYIWDNGHTHPLSPTDIMGISNQAYNGLGFASNFSWGVGITIGAAATGIHVWDGASWDQTGGAGGNNGHNHPLNLNLAYLDVIMATKN